MFSKTLLSTLSLALVVSASPILVDKAPVNLDLTRRLNLTSTHNLVRHDRARAQQLKASRGAGTGVISSPADNQAVTYVASVSVGNPATTYSLLIDTGSSNTWVGAQINNLYHPSLTTKPTLDAVSVTYGSGSFSGLEVIDKVSLGSGLTIPEQSIGVATPITAAGFNGVDGILGIGPVNLTVGTLTPGSTKAIPTVTDNLYSLGIINSNVLSISFEPTTTEQVTNGELTWGGVDSSLYSGDITYVPITSTFPASEYWGIDQSVKYGTSNEILSNTAGIVDTGTTLILLATDAYNKYVSATGAVLDNATGLLQISPSQYSNLQSLFFNIGGTAFELTPNAQIFPRSLNTEIGGSSNSIYLIVADLGADSGQGLDFINGYAFLERFYSVYDTSNKRVGIANTPFTHATTN
ncbi:aspartic peptidase A1 [Crepidotus variabilis]|uniref:Aspartic peptidase A1 n=1 Tax=Crepidotus variabilis TaxID=179855 RepID=A0A9P6ERU8_9AGAR|nr:aspartic peptidase A1 [Crepidotus variabilis]